MSYKRYIGYMIKAMQWLHVFYSLLKIKILLAIRYISLYVTDVTLWLHVPTLYPQCDVTHVTLVTFCEEV